MSEPSSIDEDFDLLADDLGEVGGGVLPTEGSGRHLTLDAAPSGDLIPSDVPGGGCRGWYCGERYVH